MYAAKARGSYSPNGPGRDPRGYRRPGHGCATELDLALVLDDQFWMDYQPIVDLRSEEHLGVEALIRWMHPERGLLSPADFIDEAESSGQIEAIGEWALRTACHATAGLASDAYTSVNISARQLRLPQLADMVARALDTSGLPAGRLVLEITETATVSNIADASARLRELKTLGVQDRARRLRHRILTVDPPPQLPRGHPEDRQVVRPQRRARARATGPSSEESSRSPSGSACIPSPRASRKPISSAAMRDLGCDSGQGYLWTRPVALETLEVARVVRRT